MIKQDSTDEGGDDVTSSPAMSDCEPGMVDLTQQQVLASTQATLALTPQPIMLPPGGKGCQQNNVNMICPRIKTPKLAFFLFAKKKH